MASIEDILHDAGLQPGLQATYVDDHEAATNVCYSLFGLGFSTLAYAGWRYRNIWLPLMPSVSNLRYCMVFRSCVNTSTAEGNQSVVIEMGFESNSITGHDLSGSSSLTPTLAFVAEGSARSDPLFDLTNSNAANRSNTIVSNDTYSIDFRNLGID